MPLSRCLIWIMEFMQSLFQTSISSPSPPPSPPMELCNDILFEIFLRLPPKTLPRIRILNKQFNDMINSSLFQTTYWTQKIQLPRHYYARVYYQHKMTNRIGFALTNIEHNHKFNRNEFHKYTQVPQTRYYTRIFQWTNHIGPNGIIIQKENEWQKRHGCNMPTAPSIKLHNTQKNQ